MTVERTKILDKAKKLKELAVRGVGGEMQNAKTMLNSYMKKHNITDDELSGHSPSSSFVDMSDEAFMNEMIKEIIPVILGSILSRYGNQNMEDYSNAQTQNFLNKYLSAIIERVDNKK
jgi:hypothetical protein